MSSLTSEGFLSAPGTSTEENMELSCENEDKENLLSNSNDYFPPYQEPKNKPQSRRKEPTKPPSNQKSSKDSRNHGHKNAKERISHLEQAIKSLKRHTKKELCPESLQHRARVRIRADTDFKTDIKGIQKNAEQEYVRALKPFKVRPVFDSVCEKCRQLPEKENHSVDEQITPTKSHTSLKQYLPNKPKKWGIKVRA